MEQTISQHRTGFLMFSKSTCPACDRAKRAIRSRGLPLYVVNMSEMDRKTMSECQDYLFAKTGARTVPRIFFNGGFMGGSSEVLEILAKHGDKIARSCLNQSHSRRQAGDVSLRRKHTQAGLRGQHLSVPRGPRHLSVPHKPVHQGHLPSGSQRSSPYASPQSSPYHSPQSSPYTSPQSSPYASPRDGIRPRTHRVGAVQQNGYHHRHSPSPSPSPSIPSGFILRGFDVDDILEREAVNSCPPTPPSSTAGWRRSAASRPTSRGSVATSRGSDVTSRGSVVTSRASSTAFPFPEEYNMKAVSVYVQASQEKSEHCLPKPAYGRTPKRHATPKDGVVCEGGVCYISPRRTR